MEHLSSAPAVASPRLFHLNHAAIVRFSVVTATRLVKAAAAVVAHRVIAVVVPTDTNDLRLCRES